MFSNKISSKTPRRFLFLFEILALLLLFIHQKDNFDKQTFINGFALIVIIYASNYILLKVSRGDNYIFLIATMLVSIGAIMIYRMDAKTGTRQLMWLFLSILIFYATYFMLKYIKIWDKLLYVYIGGAYLLFGLTFALGERKFGAINWINIKGVSLQPAEITKLLVIFIMAAYYSNYNKYKKTKYSSYLILGIMYSFIALLFLQRDLGMAVLMYGIYIGLQFIYEEDRKLIAYNIGLFIISGIIGYFAFNHVRVRVETWLNPWIYINDKGYQITQSLFAIAEGGFW